MVKYPIAATQYLFNEQRLLSHGDLSDLFCEILGLIILVIIYIVGTIYLLYNYVPCCQVLCIHDENRGI